MNLFPNAVNAVLTVVFGAVPRLGRLPGAAVRRSSPPTGRSSAATCACSWSGRYPADELWRPWVSLYLAVAGLASRRRRLRIQAGGVPADRRSPPRPLETVGAAPAAVAGRPAARRGRCRSPRPSCRSAPGAGRGRRSRSGVGSPPAGAPLGVARRWWLVAGVLLVAAVVVPSLGSELGWEDWGGLQLTRVRHRRRHPRRLPARRPGGARPPIVAARAALGGHRPTSSCSGACRW